MITINYKQDNYGTNEEQPYDIETKINFCSDVSGYAAMKGFIRLLNIATYEITLSSLKSWVQLLEDEGYKDNDRIM